LHAGANGHGCAFACRGLYAGLEFALALGFDDNTQLDGLSLRQSSDRPSDRTRLPIVNASLFDVDHAETRGHFFHDFQIALGRGGEILHVIPE
jgi:hypothetical protein